jgi:hypothetical protein
MSIIIIKAQSLREHYFGFEYSEYNLWGNKTTSLKKGYFSSKTKKACDENKIDFEIQS